MDLDQMPEFYPQYRAERVTPARLRVFTTRRPGVAEVLSYEGGPSGFDAVMDFLRASMFVEMVRFDSPTEAAAPLVTHDVDAQFAAFVAADTEHAAILQRLNATRQELCATVFDGVPAHENGVVLRDATTGEIYQATRSKGQYAVKRLRRVVTTASAALLAALTVAGCGSATTTTHRTATAGHAAADDTADPNTPRLAAVAVPD